MLSKNLTRREVPLNPLCLVSLPHGEQVTIMINQSHNRARYVIGPDGTPLTLADLPPQDTTRWVARRKATLVAAARRSGRRRITQWDLSVGDTQCRERSARDFGKRYVRSWTAQKLRKRAR